MIRKLQQFKNKYSFKQMKEVDDVKTFVLENQATFQSKIVYSRVPAGVDPINIENVLMEIPEPRNKLFRLFDASKSCYIPFEFISEEPFTLPAAYLKLKFILIQYADRPLGNQPQNLERSQTSEDHKKQRSKERSIKEVIELVQEWRDLHNHPEGEKKMNLQQAALALGVSKKSLDDYYYQLRIGEKHSFDFAEHLNDKIGVLRTFIKEREPEKRGVRTRNAKHPKNLKIIEQFENKLTLDEESKAFSKPELKLKQSDRKLSFGLGLENDSGQIFWEPSQNSSSIPEIDMKDCEENYFKLFSNPFDEPSNFMNFPTNLNKEPSMISINSQGNSKQEQQFYYY